MPPATLSCLLGLHAAPGERRQNSTRRRRFGVPRLNCENLAGHRGDLGDHAVEVLGAVGAEDENHLFARQLLAERLLEAAHGERVVGPVEQDDWVAGDGLHAGGPAYRGDSVRDGRGAEGESGPGEGLAEADDDRGILRLVAARERDAQVVAPRRGGDVDALGAAAGRGCARR